MRALAVFPDRQELGVIDLPPPAVTSPRDVLVRVREVGICGTDREIAAFHFGTPPPGAERLVLGHEAIGEVVETGPSVEALEPGDLVAMTVRRPCDVETCQPCRAGRQDFCVSGGFRERGIKGADGFMTELVVEDERYLVPVPPALADVGVLIEPLTIAAKASIELQTVARRFPWQHQGLRALVLGAGPIGLLGAMTLVAHDIETFVYSREPTDSPRAALIRSIGATYVSAEDVPLPELPSQMGHVHVIFEAVGLAQLAFGALHTLTPNGVCILSGVPGGQSSIEMDLDGIMRDIVHKNQTIFGTVNASRSAFEESVSQLEGFMSRFPDAVQSLITDRVGIDDAADHLRRTTGIKEIVTIGA